MIFPYNNKTKQKKNPQAPFTHSSTNCRNLPICLTLRASKNIHLKWVSASLLRCSYQLQIPIPPSYFQPWPHKFNKPTEYHIFSLCQLYSDGWTCLILPFWVMISSYSFIYKICKSSFPFAFPTCKFLFHFYLKQKRSCVLFVTT